jgi:hypothetical protein
MKILAIQPAGPIIDTGANGHFITVVDALRYSTTLALHLRLSSGAPNSTTATSSAVGQLIG